MIIMTTKKGIVFGGEVDFAGDNDDEDDDCKRKFPPFLPPRAEGAFGFLLDHPDPRSSCTEIQ